MHELGYGGIKVAIKCDAAPDHIALGRFVAAKRASPTVPIDVPARESKDNGAMERVVRTWSAQFRTLKSQFEEGIGCSLDKAFCIAVACLVGC